MVFEHKLVRPNIRIICSYFIWPNASGFCVPNLQTALIVVDDITACLAQICLLNK